ncbi:hypothetical protein GR254_20335 [Mycobacterium tuberculosis]|nr:hypothetical protein [Mycobacterium tuberculosis]
MSAGRRKSGAGSGTLVPFDIARIEAAVTRAAREVACDDPDMPGTVARTGGGESVSA